MVWSGIDGENVREKNYALEMAQAPFSDKEKAYIAQHQIYIGMSREALLASFGLPAEINRTVIDGVTSEQFVYKKLNGQYVYVYVDNGFVTGYQD